MNEKLKVVVITEGGVIQDVISNKDMEVLVIDNDIEFQEEHDIVQIEGIEAYVYQSIKSASVEPERVEKIYTEAEENKKMFIIDNQNRSNYVLVTLEGARDWLTEYWEDNVLDEFESDEEFNEFLERIAKADWDTLEDMLCPIEYSLSDELY